MGSTVAPQEQPHKPSLSLQSASGGSESSAAHSRSGSFGPLDGRASNPTSAGSQFSALSFASQYGIGRPTGDPVSAVGSLYSNASESMDNELLESFDELTLEKARAADVEDLDDEGWRIVSQEKRIIELGNLGEGAGGAVTKCKLKGHNTVFALKVCIPTVASVPGYHLADSSDYHNEP
jgi:mitogen-activated protein kinase kinase